MSDATATVINAKHSSEKVLHYTPIEIAEASRTLMGVIDLDPASDAIANQYVVKASTYFDEQRDGLSLPWHGNILLNPPGGLIKWDTEKERWFPVKHGGKSAQAIWWDKLQEEYLAGRVKEAIFVGFNGEIVHTRTSILNYPICMVQKRIKFLHPQEDDTLEVGKNPTHHNVIVYLPPLNNQVEAVSQRAKFAELFSIWGPCGVFELIPFVY